METILILAAIGIVTWLVVRRRAQHEQAAFVGDMFESYSYRKSMDAILDTHGIALDGTAEQDKLAREVILGDHLKSGHT